MWEITNTGTHWEWLLIAALGLLVFADVIAWAVAAWLDRLATARPRLGRRGGAPPRDRASRRRIAALPRRG